MGCPSMGIIEIEDRLDELKNHGVEHCAGHSDAPGSCGTCIRIAELERLKQEWIDEEKTNEVMQRVYHGKV